MKLYKLILIHLIIMLLMIKCNTSHEKFTYYDTGELREKFEYPTKTDYINNQNYTAYFYYKDGKLKNYTTVRNGKRENEYLAYYPSGILEQIILFKGGVKHGIQKDFNTNGEIIEETFYINNTPLTKMKSSNINNERIHFYYYVDKDTCIEDGRLIFNLQNEVIPERSFYYQVIAKDTISSDEEYSFELNVYTYGTDNIIKELLIGTFDESYNFIDSTKLISLSSKNNSIKHALKPTKKGNNLVMGKFYVEGNANTGNETIHQSREFIFYTDFYVTE